MASTLRISTSFLNSLKARFPPRTEASALRNSSPWYIVAAVAFSASNRPEGVPQVFEHALADLRAQGSQGGTSQNQNQGGAAAGGQGREEERLLAQKMREALLKSGLISGYPKAINGLKALHEVMPEELQDKELLRDPSTPLGEYEAEGMKLFNSVYGEKSEEVNRLLDTIYPDMGWFSRTIGYGLVYGPTQILSALETSYTLVAALIAGDTPQQIAWHLDGARRGGATLEEVRAVRWVSIEVARLAGVRWESGVPEVKED